MYLKNELLNSIDIDDIKQLLVIFLAFALCYLIIRIFAKKQDTSNYCKKLNAETKAMIALHKEGIDMAKEKASDCPPQKRQPLKNTLKDSLMTTAIGEVIKQTIKMARGPSLIL